MVTWEHKVLTSKLKWKGFDYSAIETELNELGQQGWEVVKTIVPSMGSGQSLEVALILKRPTAS